LEIDDVRNRIGSSTTLDSFEGSLCAFLQAEAQRGVSGRLTIGGTRRWSATAQWRATARRLSPAEQVRVMVELGHRVFDADLGNYRTDLEFNTRRIGDLGGSSRRRELLREHCAFLFVSLLDPLVLTDRPLRAAAFENVELIGQEHADATLAAGRGLVFLGCHQTHSGFAFGHPHFARWKFTAVRNPFDAEGFRARRSEQAYGENVDFVPTTPGGAARLLDCLTSGGCVALQNDFCFSETVGVPATFFGCPVLVSRSFVKLILRTKSPVLPISVVRLQPFESQKIRVEIFPPLPLEDLTEARRDQAIAAMRLSVATECVIRRHPAQWTHWTSLEHRWSQAIPAWSKLERLMTSDTASDGRGGCQSEAGSINLEEPSSGRM
jgi:lauroyl/myristoyl acyltransferase